MKKLAIFVFLPLLGACAQIQESAAAVEEAFGTTGALLTTTPYKKSELSPVADRRFDQLVEIYFDTNFALNPARGTRAGFHRYDSQTGGYTKAEIEKAIEIYKQLDRDLSELDVHSLSAARPIDWEILSNRVKGALLDLQEIRHYERDPSYYLGLISEGAFSLTARNFASEETRLQALVARLKTAPIILDHAKLNLKNPPRIYTEIAIDQADGAVRFFENEVRQAFSGKISAQWRSSFEEANSRTVEALRNYRNWLEKSLLEESHGNYAIGGTVFRKKLLYDEMVDMSVESLVAKGEEELGRLATRARELANQIQPGARVQDIIASMSKNHPAPASLVSKTQSGLEEIRNFCIQKGIVRFPNEERPVVRETPPFRRSLSFASMDSPGAYETKSTEAYYSVTLPAPEWPQSKQEEHMRFFSDWALPIVSIHEVYPGHFTQFVWVKEASSKVRKLIGCGTNAEGWAHYAEEMMLEEGYGNQDPKLWLAQTQLALVRACRYLVGIKMHCRNMTVSEATNFFMDHAYLDRANAEREARRGTADPTYLVYTLGKKMILKLRDDYRNAQSDGFSLAEFHNAFLACGYPPIPIVRKLLLPGDKSGNL